MGGCGKGEALKYLENKGLKSVVMRTVVEDEMREKGVEVNNKNLREYATKIREEGGMDIVAKMCVPLVKKLLEENENILIDGVRSYDEVELFKKEFGEDFVLIAIFAPFKIRFERLKKRGRPWDIQDEKGLRWRDKKELEWGVGKSIALADMIIDNSGSLEEFHSKLDKIFSKLDL